MGKIIKRGIPMDSFMKRSIKN